MMDQKPMESDWKTFQKRVPEWRERYLETRNRELIGILTDESKTPTERFWNAEERIGKDAKLVADLLDGHSRTKMTWFLFLMYGHGFLQDADLEEFSEELRDWLRSSRGLRK